MSLGTTTSDMLLSMMLLEAKEVHRIAFGAGHRTAAYSNKRYIKDERYNRDPFIGKELVHVSEMIPWYQTDAKKKGVTGIRYIGKEYNIKVKPRKHGRTSAKKLREEIKRVLETKE
jgi:hypothetical protein